MPRISAAARNAIYVPNSRSIQNEESHFIPHQRTSPALRQLGNA